MVGTINSKTMMLMKIFYILWGLPQLLCYLYYCKRIPEIVEDLKSFTNSGGEG